MTYAFIVLFLLAGGYIAYRVWKDYKIRKAEKWLVPIELLNEILPMAEAQMVLNGYGKGDYVLGKKDCKHFSLEWMRVLRQFLELYRPNGETEWMRQYRFKRDPRPDGSEPGWHRLVAIKTDVGIRYIDSYRINGAIYRSLSLNETSNGQVY